MENIPVWLTHLSAIIFGLVCGSFANVLIVRLPHGQSVVRPRSRCCGCHREIAWWDNIPVLSYLILKGKCRACRMPISVRYPIIELLCAFLFLAANIRFGWSPLLFVRDWPFLTLLVAISFIDLEHRIIPDPLSLGGLILGLITAFFAGEWITSIMGALLGFGCFYALAAFYHRITGRVGLGGGDIKLLAMLGAFIGPSGIIVTIMISSIFGSVVGVVWALWTKKHKVMRVSIPYGPFLVVGGLYYYFLGDILWFQFMIPM